MNSPFAEAVDHRALEAELRDARSSSSAAASGSAVGSAANPAKRFGLVATISASRSLTCARQFDRVPAEIFCMRRRAMRQHLDVDAGLVHLLEAQPRRDRRAVRRLVPRQLRAR